MIHLCTVLQADLVVILQADIHRTGPQIITDALLSLDLEVGLDRDPIEDLVLVHVARGTAEGSIVTNQDHGLVAVDIEDQGLLIRRTSIVEGADLEIGIGLVTAGGLVQEIALVGI